MEICLLNPLSVSDPEMCYSGWVVVVNYKYPQEMPGVINKPFKGGSFLDNIIHTRNENGSVFIECVYTFNKKIFEPLHRSWVRAKTFQDKIQSYIVPEITR